MTNFNYFDFIFDFQSLATILEREQIGGKYGEFDKAQIASLLNVDNFVQIGGEKN